MLVSKESFDSRRWGLDEVPLELVLCCTARPTSCSIIAARRTARPVEIGPSPWSQTAPAVWDDSEYIKHFSWGCFLRYNRHEHFARDCPNFQHSFIITTSTHIIQLGNLSRSICVAWWKSWGNNLSWSRSGSKKTYSGLGCWKNPSCQALAVPGGFAVGLGGVFLKSFPNQWRRWSYWGSLTRKLMFNLTPSMN